jgi:MFS family permease
MERTRILPGRQLSSAARHAHEPLRSGPLTGRYPAAAAMVILFLVPYLGLSSALGPLNPIIASQLHMSPQTVSLATGLANAAYAFGTVLAVQLAQLLPQRRMMIVYGSLLVIGSILAATATGPGQFIAGHILQGLFTSMLLIAGAGGWRGLPRCSWASRRRSCARPRWS